MEINPDHYKYMPKPEGEPEPQEGQPAESLEAVEEVVIVESRQTEVAETPSMQAETLEEERFDEDVHQDEEEGERAAFSDLEEGDTALTAACKAGLRFFYDLFNPMLIPAYATFLMFELTLLALVAPGAAFPYALTVLGATGAIPFIAVFVLLRVGSLGGMNLPSRKDRIFPYIIELLAMGAMTIFFLYKGAGANWIWLIFCGATTSVLVNFLLNFKIRVSNHCTAIAALLAMLIVIKPVALPGPALGWWAIGTVGMAGLLGTGAILLGKHSLKEVIIGYATGFLPIILFALIK